MEKSQSLDELISRQAAEFAEHVRNAAALASNEEEIKMEVEKQLAFIQKEAGIKLDAKYEFTIAQGRADSVYSRVIIEYKNPASPSDRVGPKPDSPGTKKVVAQIKNRFHGMRDEHGHPLNSLFGVGLDGLHFVFVRFREGKWDVQDPVEVTRYSTEGLLRTLHDIGVMGRPQSKPFLRWAGSKRKQLARLKAYWSPTFQRYIEPFAGSACLFFDLEPPEAILGDNNAALMEVYRVVRDDPERLYRRLSHIPRDAETYYRWRRMKPDRLDKATRALRFVYLNRNCFNGIYRTNEAGVFNVPLGQPPIAYLTKLELLRCSAHLAKAKLVVGDFAKTLALARYGDFVYMDPPFAVQSRRVFREYGERSFEPQDMPRLAQELRRLDGIGAHFLVSYADCSQARRLAGKWTSIRFATRRNVSGFADHRRNAYEWLISNLPIPDAIRRPRV
jgi:DNA adenine methylase